MTDRSSSKLGYEGGLGRILAITAIAAVAACASVQPAFGSPGSTELVSVTPDATTGDAASGAFGVAISDGGRFVAFASTASDLVPGDTEDSSDVFVRDRLTGSTERVSVNLMGSTPDDPSDLSTISADGRFVVFTSTASDLVAGDRDQTQEVFLRDRLTGVTSQISVDSAGRGAKGSSFVNRNVESISGDGRFVAFSSSARLVPEDQNGLLDVYVRDRATGTTTIVSRGIDRVDGNGSSFSAPISANGRYVAFGSLASNLVAGDTNGVRDVFVHDRATGATTRVSVDSAGVQGDRASFVGSISGDGRHIGFYSEASNLVPNDTNRPFWRDVFVHDRVTATTTRVNVASDGSQANFGGSEATLSTDGRYIAFSSHSTNLVPEDTNDNSDIFLHDRITGVTTRESVDSAGRQSNDFSFLAALSGDGTTLAYASLATNLTANEDVNSNGKGRRSNDFLKFPWDVFSHELQPAAP